MALSRSLLARHFKVTLAQHLQAQSNLLRNVTAMPQFGLPASSQDNTVTTAMPAPLSIPSSLLRLGIWGSPVHGEHHFPACNVPDQSKLGWQRYDMRLGEGLNACLASAERAAAQAKAVTQGNSYLLSASAVRKKCICPAASTPRSPIAQEVIPSSSLSTKRCRERGRPSWAMAFYNTQSKSYPLPLRTPFPRVTQNPFPVSSRPGIPGEASF